MLWLNICIIAVASYLLGSFNGSIFVSRCVFHNDIRNLGSGNAGLTNFLRSFGGPMTFVVVAIDMLKAAGAALLGGLILGPFGFRLVGQMLGLFFVVLGHMFPLYFSFRGGKGILSTCGAMFVVNWLAITILLFIFGVFTLLSGRVSVGSIIAAISFPVSVWLLCGHNLQATAIAVACGVLILIMHRSNIARLIKGEEPKFSIKKHGGSQ
ncbi:MAG: glycerol-3-phosphate acyltransferase [Oscillospiraceae bacterium]